MSVRGHGNMHCIIIVAIDGEKINVGEVGVA